MAGFGMSVLEEAPDVVVSAAPLAPHWLAAFAPPPELTISQWAEAHRVLPDTSAEPGRWRNARAPYLVGIMDALTDHATEIVVLMKGAQLGGSEVLLNALGYFIEHDPSPGLLVQPTITMAEAFSKDRLSRMIQDTPALAALVQEGRGPDAESTITHKLFPGGYLALAGANSPASLAQRPVRLLFADDVDRFPPVVGEEGDPLELAIRRTATFANRKIMIVSTPTITGGRIDGWFRRSDQRRFTVPCPRCGRRDYLTWNQPAHLRVTFDDRDPSTAALACPAPDYGGCGGRIEDHERAGMLAAGVWVPTAPATEPGLAGFHVWEGYALALDTPIPTPTGWTTMELLKPGDEIFDERGHVCRVLEATGIMLGHTCYRVRFSDGSEIVADAQHRWRIENARGSSVIMATEELAGRTTYRCGLRRYAVRVALPLDLPDADLPVHPYILGAWLGDGSSRGARLFAGAVDADEMAEALRACGVDVLLRRGSHGVAILQMEPGNKSAGQFVRGRPKGSHRGTSSESVFGGLRSLGLLHDGQSRKVIPAAYLRASRMQRLSLLQGLMDTDGHIAAKNQECSYSTTSPDIAAGVEELLSSLGLKYHRYERHRGVSKREIRLNFVASHDVPIFRLTRKRARQARISRREKGLERRKIIAVDPVPAVPVKCIAVDSASQLYLAGRTMIPTHNSPWVLLRELVAKFLSANARGRESLRVFINTSLGEPWEDQVQRIEPQGLLARREDYGAGIEAPAAVACLTAGVDTQDDRFELLVLGWGLGEEKWVVDWRQIPGDPRRAETKAALLEALTRRYTHAFGVALPIHAACLDSGGHRTDDVYDFVLAHQHLRCYATIGRSGLSGKPLVGPPSPKRYGRNPRPVPLYTVNVDDGKSAIASSLGIAAPGPGYLHLPAGVETVDESFVAQLTAEQLVTRHKAGVAYQVWVQIRAENHALDCAVLALAAFRLLRPNLNQMVTAIREHAARAPTRTSPPAPATPPAVRRSAVSPYLA